MNEKHCFCIDPRTQTISTVTCNFLCNFVIHVHDDNQLNIAKQINLKKTQHVIHLAFVIWSWAILSIQLVDVTCRQDGHGNVTFTLFAIMCILQLFFIWIWMHLHRPTKRRPADAKNTEEEAICWQRWRSSHFIWRSDLIKHI